MRKISQRFVAVFFMSKKRDTTTSVAVINTPRKVAVTRRQKVKVLIPELAEYIIQPNIVTNARYEYTLIQERIFTAIMYYLQNPIEELIHHADAKQLSLFKENEEDPYQIKIAIPMNHITRPDDYDRILPQAKKMVETAIVFPYKDENGEDIAHIYPLIAGAIVPMAGNRRCSHIELTISRKVAEILISVQKRGTMPVMYTRFVYQIAQNSSSKYTSLLYKKIASWKVKGGFTISLEDLYRDICVRKVYKTKDGNIDYRHFKERVLERAKEELYQKADCWFEYQEHYEGRRVKSLTFKVITPEMEQTQEDQIFYLKKLMIDLLRVYEKDIPAGLFEKVDLPTIGAAILRIKEAIDTVHPTNKKGYAIKSLQNLMINDK